MKCIVLLLFLSTTIILSSQSDFLDPTYGNQGTSTIDIEGFNFWAYDFDVDRSGNAYLFNQHFTYIMDSLVTYPFKAKLDQNGVLIESFLDNDQATAETLGTRSFGFSWVENEKILKYHTTVLNFDTVDVLSRLDLDFNLEQTYEVNLSLFLFGGLLGRPHLDSKSRLIVNDFGLFKRYLSDGTLDTDFGNSGETRVITPLNANDSLWHAIYNSYLITDQDELIINGYQNIPNNTVDEPWYDAFILKMDEQGKLDTGFGTNGRYENKEWEFFEYIAMLDDDELFVRAFENDLTDTLCNITDYNLMKLDANGNLETSFGDAGYFDDNIEGCNSRNYSFIKGPSNKFAFIQEELIDDSLFINSYSLGVMNYDGTSDTEFNNGELLNLDFIPGTYAWEITMDLDYNVYLFSSDNTFILGDTTPKNQLHVSKLDGNKIWDLSDFNSSFDEGAISMYPNPTSSNLIFNNNGPEVPNVTLIIYDILGRSVLVDSDFQLYRGPNKYHSLEQTLVSGNYYVQLRTSDGQKIYGAPFIFIGKT